MSAFRQLACLEDLCITGSWQLSALALSGLAHLPLKVLALTIVDTLAAFDVASLPRGLLTLRLGSSELGDDAVLSLPPRLQDLRVCMAFRERGLGFLAGLPLRCLCLRGSDSSAALAFSPCFNRLGRTLVSLELDSVAIADRDLQALRLPLLVVLSLQSCVSLTDECLTATVVSGLRVLDLCGVATISDAGVSNLAGHRALQKLGLSGTFVSDESVVVLQTMPRLTQLAVRWCPNVSMHGPLEELSAALTYVMDTSANDML